MAGQELFGRKVELTIGKKGEQGFLYKDLRIAFKVEKSLESKPNKGEIKVYNLTRDNRAKAEQNGNVIILKAGYGEQLESIFTGDVAKAKTELDGVDYVTTFELGDGEIQYRTARAELSFAKGTDVKEVMKTILAKVGGILGDVSGLSSEKLQAPMVFSGDVRKHLDDVAVRQGFEWSIQDGAYQIIGNGKATKENAVFLSAKTGLIGIPKNRVGKDISAKGIEFDALLNGKIKPGRKVVIESKFFSGIYRIEKVKFEGDNFGKEFYARCEAGLV